MNFNVHSNLQGKHAFLGASKYHWIRYDRDKLANVYRNHLAVQRGTELHAFAAERIEQRKELPRLGKTLDMYVNDAIEYDMTPEVTLYYSDNCFGTTDAICFDEEFLRIHDFKSGVTPAHMEQLEIYAALFCLEYNHDPNSIQIELRIYQCDECVVHNPTAEDISTIMEKIIEYDQIVTDINYMEG